MPFIFTSSQARDEADFRRQDGSRFTYDTSSSTAESVSIAPTLRSVDRILAPVPTPFNARLAFPPVLLVHFGRTFNHTFVASHRQRSEALLMDAVSHSSVSQDSAIPLSKSWTWYYSGNC